MKNSKTLSKMISQGVGYRVESYSGSKVRNLFDVVHYEIFELGNEDILDYMEKKYNLKGIQLHSREFFREDEEAEFRVARQIVDYCTFTLGAEKVIGIWLTTLPNVKKFYKLNSDDEITKVPLDRKYMVISDLDEDGALFVFAA